MYNNNILFYSGRPAGKIAFIKEINSSKISP